MRFNKDDFLMPIIVLCAILPRDISHYSMRDRLFFSFSIGNLISIIPEMRIRNSECDERRCYAHHAQERLHGILSHDLTRDIFNEN